MNAIQSQPAPSSGSTRRWLGMSAVLAAMILNLLDSTIVNVAAPSIQRDLGGSYASLQWIAAVYTLALAVGLLTGGRLGDMYGRRRMMLAGVAGFTVASVACAAAWSPESLIAARAAQGLCGALLVPQIFGLIRDMFPPAEIGKAFAALGPVIGLSTIAGPVLAGVLVDADVLGLGWRTVFLLNLPIGLAVLAAGAVALPPGEGGTRGRLDVVGALMSGGAMLLLTYPLVQGREDGWGAPHLAMVVTALGLLAGFVVHQRRRTLRGAVRLVELSVLARRSYAAGVAFVVVFFGAIVGFSLTVSLALQLGLGYDATGASLVMGAWAIGSFLGSGVGAIAMHRLGRRIVHLGLAWMAAALAVMVAVFAELLGPVVSWPLFVALGAYGLGMGMVFVPLFDIIMAEVADHEVGSASGMLESLQQLGASLGVAALATLFFDAAGELPTVGSSLDGVRLVAITALVLTLVAYALAFLLPRRARAAVPPAGSLHPHDKASENPDVDPVPAAAAAH